MEPGRPQEEVVLPTYSPAEGSTHLASMTDTNVARLENPERGGWHGALSRAS